MSATTRRESYECANCGGPRADDSYGSYCSAECYYRAEGQALINRVSHDGRFCATCYGRLRDVEPIDALNAKGPAYEPRVTCPECDHDFRVETVSDREYDLESGGPEAACPECDHTFQYVRTFQRGPKNVADGLQYARSNLTHGVDARDGPNGYYEFQRESCVCGAVDPNATTAEIQRADLETVRENLFLAVRWFGWTDDNLPIANRDRYDEALRERPYDAAYAAGYATYGDDE